MHIACVLWDILPGQLPPNAGKVDDHVSNEEAHHAKHAPAGAHQRQAGVLKCRAEEVACTEHCLSKHATRCGAAEVHLPFVGHWSSIQPHAKICTQRGHCC